jgi:aminoglycoside/choline kinase family phosphotransferase
MRVTVAEVGLTHPHQRNHTWRVRSVDGREGVAKEYAHLRGKDVQELFKIERRLRSSGLPMPEMITWSADPPTTIHEYVEGQHCTQPTAAMIDDAVRVFGRHLKALRSESAPWTPRRPVGLPRRSRQAAIVGRSTALRNAIVGSWRRLTHLAMTQPSVTTHGDWRADNLLYAGDRVVAVLDWEILIDVPVSEAVGYAAASLTHSWRPELRSPLDPSVVVRFLERAEALRVLPGETAGHARLAAFHMVAVRLAEDTAAGIPTPTLTAITRHLGARQ